MRLSRLIPVVPAFTCAALITLIASCDRNITQPLTVPTSALASASTDATVKVCHIPANGTGNIISVSMNALDAHIAHGDYPSQLLVDHAFANVDEIHFTRISDAIAAADSTRRAHGERTSGACRITIRVAAGNYAGSFTARAAALERLPLLVIVPDVSLIGAFVMHVDVDGRATGTSDGGIASVVPDHGMGPNDALVVVGADSAGYHGDRVTVQGFRFSSGFDTLGTTSGGIGVGGMRVRDLMIAGNKFDPTLNTAVDARGSGVTITRNHGRKLAVCGICLAGPGRYAVSDNRVLDGGFTALFAAPIVIRSAPLFTTTQYPAVLLDPIVAVAIAADTTTVTNNDLSGNVRQVKGFGSGIRVVSFSLDAPSAAQHSVVTLLGNRFYHNNFAIDVDANTPLVTSPPGVATVGLVLQGNVIGPSCRNNLFVSFARISRTFSKGTESYLNHSTYTLTLSGNTPWSNAWYDNSLGTDDHLIVDGVEIPVGKKISPSDNPAGC